MQRAAEHLGGIEAEEIDRLATEALEARNRYINRSGYSAHQRVYGKSLRLPASLMSDDPVDRELLTLAAGDDFQRSYDLRQAAHQGLVEQTDRRAVAAASRARSRTQPQGSVKPGDLAFIWRCHPRVKKRGWQGSGCWWPEVPTAPAIG